MTKKQKIIFICIVILTALIWITPALMADSDTGNSFNDSFSLAKKLLEKEIYPDHRITVYCGAEFTEDKKVILPPGFKTSKYQSRADRIEWEHVVPAENFGRTFSEWRDGHPDCVDAKGKAFKGRKCAELTNREYRLMQADMYNLYPAIGAVNALRQNYNFTQFQNDTKSSFGSCSMKIQDKKAEPPPLARGVIARTYLYFDGAYHRYRMSPSQRKLMEAWDKEYPIEPWECERACRIQNIQKNTNQVLKKRCQPKGLWEC
ncbi:MAG: endonuclease [Alphaproteobacteria bacterium]|nr:endonuclease [Alphaproteobacteria bacterium]